MFSAPFIARVGMGTSLAFHIIFACIGIVMPVLMCLAEFFAGRHRDEEYLTLAKTWAKGTAVFFAIGAVSGTVLSFELGLLFPKFMETTGAAFGLPFALEGFAFFAEAIFLGLYLYGWDRLSRPVHLACGILVAISGIASAVFVTLANAWMNAPSGIRWENGRITDIRPLEVFMSPAAAHEVLHGTTACFVATAFAVAGIHAWVLLRKGRISFHEKALKLALLVAIPASLLQPVLGHWSGAKVIELQPLKFAAMEGQFHAERGAPLRLGGWPDEAREETRFALEIPKLLSFLATEDWNGLVPGLTDFPRDDWPSPIVHVAFQIMVAAGMALVLVSLLVCVWAWRKRLWPRWLLWSLVLASPLGFIALEAGWLVTELGRQPWTLYGLIRTGEVVTTRPGVAISIGAFLVLYAVLGVTTGLIFIRFVRKSPGFSSEGH